VYKFIIIIRMDR